MEKKEFSTVHLSHLSNDDAASLFVQTCEHSIPVKALLGVMAGAALDDLIPKANAFSAQAISGHKSQYTEQVKGSRKTSIDLFSEIKRIVVFESKSRDAVKKQAGIDLLFFLNPYWDITKDPVGTQMEQTQELIAKYKTEPKLQTAAQGIGVDALITELETNNNALITVYQTRTVETGNHETSSSDLRPGTTDSYNQYCTIIEHAVNLMPDRVNRTLFNTLDELRKKHNALIQKPKDKGTPTA
jgi:predicted nucleotidyltransferase